MLRQAGQGLPALLVLALLLGSCLPSLAAAPPPAVAKPPPPVAGKPPTPLVGKAPPPLAGKASPPLAGNASPPLVGKAPPPAAGKAPPPLVGKAPPPAAGKAPPPLAGKAPPPLGGKAPPPLTGKAPPPVRKSPPPVKKPPSPPVKRPPPRPPLKSPPLPPRPPPPPPAPPRAACDCPMVWFTGGGSPRFGCGGGSTNDIFSPFYPNWCELDDACPSYNGIVEETGKKFKYCTPSPSTCACAPTWIYNNKTYSGCIKTPANFIFKAAGYKLCVVGSQCNDYLSTVKGTTPPNMKYRVCQYDTKPDACACLSSWSLVSGGTNRTFYGCSALSEVLNEVPYCAVSAACTASTQTSTAVQPSNKLKYCYPDDDTRCRCMEQWVVNGTTYQGCTDSLVPPRQDGTAPMYCAVAESCPNYVGRLAGSNPANLKYRGCANDYF